MGKTWYQEIGGEWRLKKSIPEHPDAKPRPVHWLYLRTCDLRDRRRSTTIYGDLRTIYGAGLGSRSLSPDLPARPGRAEVELDRYLKKALRLLQKLNRCQEGRYPAIQRGRVEPLHRGRP